MCSVAKICGKNQSPICEIVKKEKVICASLTVAPQTKEVVVTVFDKCSGKMGRHSICTIRYFEKRAQHSHLLL